MFRVTQFTNVVELGLQNPTADFPLMGPLVDDALPLCSAAAVPVTAMTSATTLMISDGDGLSLRSLILPSILGTIRREGLPRLRARVNPSLT